MSKADQVAACYYFDEAIWSVVKRTIGDKLDVDAQENIADACSKAFVNALTRECAE